MVLGIVALINFVLVLAAFLTGKLKNGSWLKKLFCAIHKPLGYILTALIVIHLVLTIPLIQQRPFIIYVLGFAMLLCVLTAIVALRVIKNKRKAFIIHKLCALVMAVFLILHIAFCITSLNEYNQQVATITFSDIEISDVTDGEYIGEYDVGYIYAEVKVTVSQGVIKDIELLKHLNERGEAGERVIPEILSKQSIDVNAISGATNSSKVIKKAVEDALEKGATR